MRALSAPDLTALGMASRRRSSLWHAGVRQRLAGLWGGFQRRDGALEADAWFGCRLCQPGGAGGRFDKNAWPPASLASIWLRLCRSWATVTWHAQRETRDPRLFPAGERRRRLKPDGLSTTDGAEAVKRTWSVQDLEPPVAAAGGAGP